MSTKSFRSVGWCGQFWCGLVLCISAAIVRGEDFPADHDAALVALRRAIDDLSQTHGANYRQGEQFRARLAQLEANWPNIRAGLAANDPAAVQQLESLRALRRDALRANPLLDFDRLLLVRRKLQAGGMGLPMNWQGNASLPRQGFDDQIAVWNLADAAGTLTTVFQPSRDAFVGDVDLYFDAGKLLFSSLDQQGRWQVFEIAVDGSSLRQVTRGDHPDVDNYDACYLPNGQILYTSTACFQGVPCVKGSDHVANLYLADADGGNVRRLSFDQDHDWCPTVMEDGRVMYLRWEYSDLPHFASRILFQMNPDGTEQKEFYGSNSYWPNSMFFARPIPGQPTKFVAVVSGHHDVPRQGELVLFDSARGRFEADGAVQRIPGYGRPIVPVIRDGLVKDSWPKFLHPWPLSDKYFLVSAQPTPQANWGLYLVDVFDNMVLLLEQPGQALLEPVPLRPTPRPPVVPSHLNLASRESSVYIEDIYAGPGLAGVPRGTVKSLRLFSYHFAYHGVGGQINRVGLDGPWDVKRVVGTVPVQADGSAFFQIPANLPLSVQPLDERGQALQLMRSWFVGMPGERVSCAGCHDRQNSTPGNRLTLALAQAPAKIAPWYGPTRGFDFDREVQVVLDNHCVRCHGGQPADAGGVLPDLTRRTAIHTAATSDAYNFGSQFTPSYLTLRSFVRAPTIESDMHLLTPLDFHAETTRLIQLLRKGHYGVKLDREAWDRLVTWIDLGSPAHGRWGDIVGDTAVANQRDRRSALAADTACSNCPENCSEIDPEAIYDVATAATTAVADNAATNAAVVVPPTAEPTAFVAASGVAGAKPRPGARPQPIFASDAPAPLRPSADNQATLDLGNGIVLELVQAPAGEFVMGSNSGHPDEQPEHRVQMTKPYWIGRCEVTNEQYGLFNPSHDSRLEHGDFLQFSEQERGYALNQPRQPVARVSWHDATEFCRWLSARSGKTVRLPTEAEWEYACRAGTRGPCWYGGLDDDFSSSANLADARFRLVDSFEPWKLPVGAIQAWRPADERFNDDCRVSALVGSFRPNPWGLCDMHGNVAEWTASLDRPYPFADDGRHDLAAPGRRVVRGGSWYDRPRYATSSYRLSYEAFQQVFDVGFRIVCEP